MLHFAHRPFPWPPLAPPPVLSGEPGVHSYRDALSGEIVFYGITTDGALLNGELRRVFPEETQAMVLREIDRDLARQDPAYRPVTAMHVGDRLRPSLASSARSQPRLAQLG